MVKRVRNCLKLPNQLIPGRIMRAGLGKFASAVSTACSMLQRRNTSPLSKPASPVAVPSAFFSAAEGAEAFDDITRDGEIRTLKGHGAGDWPNTFRSSRLIPAVEYIRAQRARTLIVEKFERFMAEWDVVVIPTNALLTTTNLTGNPQVALKCGFTGGLPRSISFHGKIYDEGSPLRVAMAYEQVTEWHKKNPTLTA